MTPALAYADEICTPTAAQISQWQIFPRPEGGIPRVTGPCPACAHTCEVTLPERVVQGGMPAALAPGAVTNEPVTRLVRCDCLFDHGAPAGVLAGCGRFWLASLASGPAGWSINSSADFGLLPAASALEAAVRDQSARTQAGAEKWLAFISALLGLFSLSGVVTASDALRGLGPVSKVAVAVAFVAALGVAATGLSLGYLAAYGWPRVTSVAGDDQLRSWYDKQIHYAETAAKRLQAAIVAAFASVGVLAVLVLLLWFLPRATGVAAATH